MDSTEAKCSRCNKMYLPDIDNGPYDCIFHYGSIGSIGSQSGAQSTLLDDSSMGRIGRCPGNSLVICLSHGKSLTDESSFVSLYSCCGKCQLCGERYPCGSGYHRHLSESEEQSTFTAERKAFEKGREARRQEARKRKADIVVSTAPTSSPSPEPSPLSPIINHPSSTIQHSSATSPNMTGSINGPSRESGGTPPLPSLSSITIIDYSKNTDTTVSTCSSGSGGSGDGSKTVLETSEATASEHPAVPRLNLVPMTSPVLLSQPSVSDHAQGVHENSVREATGKESLSQMPVNGTSSTSLNVLLSDLQQCYATYVKNNNENNGYLAVKNNDITETLQSMSVSESLESLKTHLLHLAGTGWLHRYNLEALLYRYELCDSLRGLIEEMLDDGERVIGLPIEAESGRSSTDNDTSSDLIMYQLTWFLYTLPTPIILSHLRQSSVWRNLPSLSTTSIPHPAVTTLASSTIQSTTQSVTHSQSIYTSIIQFIEALSHLSPITPLTLASTVSLVDGRQVVIKYIGKVGFADGYWLGVEIVSGEGGKHDGVVEGVRYFYPISTMHNHTQNSTVQHNLTPLGTFIKPQRVVMDDDGGDDACSETSVSSYLGTSLLVNKNPSLRQPISTTNNTTALVTSRLNLGPLSKDGKSNQRLLLLKSKPVVARRSFSSPTTTTIQKSKSTSSVLAGSQFNTSTTIKSQVSSRHLSQSQSRISPRVSSSPRSHPSTLSAVGGVRKGLSGGKDRSRSPSPATVPTPRGIRPRPGSALTVSHQSPRVSPSPHTPRSTTAASLAAKKGAERTSTGSIGGGNGVMDDSQEPRAEGAKIVYKKCAALIEVLSLSGHEHWDKRSRALKDLIHIVTDPKILKSDLEAGLFPLLIPNSFLFRSQISDLRSAIVKDICHFTKCCAERFGSSFIFGTRVLLPSLTEALGIGNKVILSHLHLAITSILSHVFDSSCISILIDGCGAAKSKDVREACAQFMLCILQSWSSDLLARHVDAMVAYLREAFTDASGSVRITSRMNAWLLFDMFPSVEHSLFDWLRQENPKLYKLLEQRPDTAVRTVTDGDHEDDPVIHTTPATLNLTTSSSIQSNGPKMNDIDFHIDPSDIHLAAQSAEDSAKFSPLEHSILQKHSLVLLTLKSHLKSSTTLYDECYDGDRTFASYVQQLHTQVIGMMEEMDQLLLVLGNVDFNY